MTKARTATAVQADKRQPPFTLVRKDDPTFVQGRREFLAKTLDSVLTAVETLLYWLFVLLSRVAEVHEVTQTHRQT